MVVAALGVGKDNVDGGGIHLSIFGTDYPLNYQREVGRGTLRIYVHKLRKCHYWFRGSSHNPKD